MKAMDKEMLYKLSKETRLLRAAPDCHITNSGDLAQFMMVVVRGGIGVYVPETSRAGTLRHDMWGTVRQLLGQLVPRMQLVLNLWPSPACLSPKLITSSSNLEKKIKECLLDAREIIYEGEANLGCTEFTDIWGKPALITKGARLLAKLIALNEMNQRSTLTLLANSPLLWGFGADSECDSVRDDFHRIRMLLCSKAKMRTDDRLTTISNIFNCTGSSLQTE